MNTNANAADINTQGQTAQVVPFRNAMLLMVEHQGQPFIPMKPVVEGMGLSWQAQHRKLTGGRFAATITEMVIVAQDGRQREMTCLPLRKLTGWLMSIHPEKIQDMHTRAAVVAYQNECDDVLWSYWNDGIATRTHGRDAMTVIGELIGMSELNVIKGLIRDKAKAVPAEKRSSFQMTMHSRLHTRFNVPRTELIQAGQFDQACNFIAAYALEGEWIGPEVERSDQDRASWSNISAALHYLEMINEVNLRYDVCKSLRALGSPAGIEIYSFLHDAMGSVRAVRRNCAEQLNWQREVAA